jgi:hypothetical protein
MAAHFCPTCGHEHLPAGIPAHPPGTVLVLGYPIDVVFRWKAEYDMRHPVRSHEPLHTDCDVSCTACDWYSTEPARRTWWGHIDATPAPPYDTCSCGHPVDEHVRYCPGTPTEPDCGCALQSV